jgi:sugar/nucleoside kinase (ribokinase family)
MSLVVTGTIGIDSIYTPHGHAERVLGGSATYFAAAASFYGPVRLVAAVGDDLPAPFRDTLHHFKGVDTRGLHVRSGSKTFAWGGKYLTNMNSRETLFTELGVLAEPPPPVPAEFRDSKVVFLANTHPGVQRAMLDNFPQRTLAVADTMDLWINTAKAELLTLLRVVDGLVLNYDEAELLTGVSNSVTAARRILEMGPKFVVVKKGEHGCLLAHREGLAALPAYPSERVIDPTGAGDSFAGGMMGELARSNTPGAFQSVRAALAHGTVIASFTIEEFSLGRLASLTRAEVDQRYQQYAAMVRI